MATDFQGGKGGGRCRQWGSEEGRNTPEYVTQESAANRNNRDNGVAEKSGGGRERERTCMPAANVAGITGVRPEHRTRGKYRLLALASLTGDQSNGARVARVYGAMWSPM